MWLLYLVIFIMLAVVTRPVWKFWLKKAEQSQKVVGKRVDTHLAGQLYDIEVEADKLAEILSKRKKTDSFRVIENYLNE